MGARISYAFWTPLLFLLVVISGLTIFIMQLFPWPILAAMIAYVSVGVGAATLRRVERKYIDRLAAEFPPARRGHRLRRPEFRASGLEVIRGKSRSAKRAQRLGLLGVAKGSRQRILVSSSGGRGRDHRSHRPQFRPRRHLVLDRRGVFLGRLDAFGDSAMGRPAFLRGWVAAAAAIVYSGRWWRGDVNAAPPAAKVIS